MTAGLTPVSRLRSVDPGAAARSRQAIEEADPAAPALYADRDRAAFLNAVFAASPYLARLARLQPEALITCFQAGPRHVVEAALSEIRAAPIEAAAAPALMASLRRAKARVHLAIALADLAGVWSLSEVTGALSDFADACLAQALAHAVAKTQGAATPDGPGAPGYFILALGKHGGRELNYSSDIDLVIAFDRARLGEVCADPQRVAGALTRAIVHLLSELTVDGYVFRVDLRLRPDPGATGAAVSTASALRYYESLGQNWERAAYIKARVCGGDVEAGASFLADLHPFIWRRSLDYAAIEDLHAMKRRMHPAGEDVSAAGGDLKRGRGGIRSVEFFAQVHQLIHGGRRPDLQVNTSMAALDALVAGELVAAADAERLKFAYERLRTWEHRVQMIADEHTHQLPEQAAARDAVAALSGAPSLSAFDAEVQSVRADVAALYDRLFGDDRASATLGAEPPGEAAQLQAAGLAEPEVVAALLERWRSGSTPAARSPRARALLERVTPALLTAAAETGAPDLAMRRFASFFEALPAGVQILSLFASEPRLLGALMRLFARAPRLARDLAQQPAALDVMLDASFFAPLDDGGASARLVRAAAAADGFEPVLNAMRRIGREERFRIAAHVALSRTGADVAGRAAAELADAAVAVGYQAALDELVRKAGGIEASMVVLGLGKLGGRELTGASDLDLMCVYDAPDPAVVSRGAASLGVNVYMARATTRMIAALSAPTEEGPLYEVDMALRPSGSAGPIAVRLSAFVRYYEEDAWTWELMALTRARVICGPEPLRSAVEASILHILARPRDALTIARDVRGMRARLAQEKPPRGPLDLKRAPGGFVDIEFLAQYLQLVVGAPERLSSNTATALDRALRHAPAADRPALKAALEALSLQQDLAQVLSLADVDGADPYALQPGLAELVFAAAGVSEETDFWSRLSAAQAGAAAAFEALVPATE